MYVCLIKVYLGSLRFEGHITCCPGPKALLRCHFSLRVLGFVCHRGVTIALSSTSRPLLGAETQRWPTIHYRFSFQLVLRESRDMLQRIIVLGGLDPPVCWRDVNPSLLLSFPNFLRVAHLQNEVGTFWFLILLFKSPV